MHAETEADKQNREKACQQLSPIGRSHFKFIEFDAKEELVTEIRKDPIGLFMIILTGAFVCVVILLLLVFLAAVDLDSFLGVTNASSSVKSLLAIGGLVMLILSVIATGISVFLYVSNVIFVTSEKIAQVLYISLFNRKISQLSIGDVQDVTVTQKGILAHIFNYGTLVIETAGEQQNYTFTYVPEPYQVSQAIVGAHERNLVKYGN